MNLDLLELNNSAWTNPKTRTSTELQLFEIPEMTKTLEPPLYQTRPYEVCLSFFLTKTKILKTRTCNKKMYKVINKLNKHEGTIN